MKNTKWMQILHLAAVGVLSLNTFASASSLNLSSTPLAVSGAADPNVMMMFDTSGSMEAIVVDSPFDEGTTYGSCSATNSLPDDSFYYYDLLMDGDTPTIDQWTNTGSWSHVTTYKWGNGSGEKCFDASKTYNSDLNQNGRFFYPTYSGNYLNWYFSNDSSSAADDFNGATQKPDTNTRLEVVQTAIKSVIGTSSSDGFSGVNVGLAGFNSSDDKAEMHMLLSDIDSGTNRSDLRTKIDSLSPSGSTPLASSLASLGRYFVEGHDQNLAISPNGTSKTVSAYTLFDNEPDYNSLSKPTSGNGVVKYSCQKNFVIALTDGEPVSDANYNDDLAIWGDGTVDHSSTDPGDFDDVAQALYETDLRPDYTDDTNNVTSYVIGFEADFDLLDRAGTNGGGGYYSTSDSTDLTSAFETISDSIFSQIGTVATVAFNASQLSSDSAVYLAQYNTARWSGDLIAYPLSDTGAIQTEAWNAATLLDSTTPSSRNIFTYNEDSNDGVEFALANLSATQKADLYEGVDADGDGSTTTDNDDAQMLLDYLRGDDSNEGTGSTNYRTRTSPLGDLVNSAPVFVGAPELNWPDYSTDSKFGASGDDYSTFKAGSAASRTEVVYIGSNDGMLHGFNASVTSTDGGKELFAYIPGAIASASSNMGMHYLAQRTYNHKFYVDLTPTISDVYISNGVSRDWRTVLIGGLRNGGRGLFALDVTDPSDFASPGTKADDVVLWEFTSADDSDLGYTYSQPTIVMMPNGKWAAIVGNGYNNDGDGHAKLFIIFIEEGVDGTWSSGDYIELDTGVGTVASPNGLSTPRVVDTDSDSVADRVYAGDLEGNLWVFDVSSNSTSSWGVAYGTKSTPAPLFVAKDSAGNTQAITSAPILAKNTIVSTVNSNEPNLIVLFGTGKYLELTDVSSNTDEMSYYAVWDAGSSGLTRSNLEVRTLTTSSSLRTVSGNAIDWTTQKGWYLDLLDSSASPTNQGERVVSDSQLRREILFFNTIIPDDTTCSAGGTGWLMSLEYDTGLAPSSAVFDINNDGSINDDDLGYVGQAYLDGLPAKSGFLGDKQYTPGSDGAIQTRDIDVGAGSKEGRLSWEEAVRP